MEFSKEDLREAWEEGKNCPIAGATFDEWFDQIRGKKLDPLTELDIKVMYNYKKGKSLSGFEGVHDNLYKLGYLDADLELTEKGREYVKNLKDE